MLPSFIITWGRPTLAEIMARVLQQRIGLARGLEPCGFVALQKCFCIGMCLCLPLFVFYVLYGLNMMKLEKNVDKGKHKKSL